MTKKEHLKYNNPEAFDLQGKRIKPGDTVVCNNNYTRIPLIGKVSHFTESGNLAIMVYYWKGKTKCDAYRESRAVIKIKSGRKK